MGVVSVGLCCVDVDWMKPGAAGNSVVGDLLGRSGEPWIWGSIS